MIDEGMKAFAGALLLVFATTCVLTLVGICLSASHHAAR